MKRNTFLENMIVDGILDMAWKPFISSQLEFDPNYLIPVESDLYDAFKKYVKKEYGFKLYNCQTKIYKGFCEHIYKPYKIRFGHWKNGGLYGCRLTPLEK